MINEQIDLFEEQYKTLGDLKLLIESFHWTGGMNDDWTPINQEYKLEFYKDLAFIVQFKDKTENGEKIIDNCCELQLVQNGLYKIIKIDAYTIGDINKNNPEQTQKQLNLINSMIKEELWKK